MPKVSRPVVWTAVAAVTGYAVVWLTQPTATTPTHHARIGHTTTVVDSSGITAEDLAAHFPRYQGGSRDPFAPGVVPPSTATASLFSVASDGTTQSGWALTGIDTINGVTSALIENSKTGDSVNLNVGDTWQGMKVASIGTDAVVFNNVLGLPTRLTFVTTVPDAPSPTAAAAAAAAAATPGATTADGMPSDSSVSPLPPMPVTDNSSARGRRRGRRQSF